MLPANEGRGYVLRRIMRRAMRHAHLLGAKDPLMYRLVPALVAEMGAAYPELVRAQPLIEATLMQEETRFRQTLANGLEAARRGDRRPGHGGTLPGETAFKLYDTFGFPYDLTEDALRARGSSGRSRRLRCRHGRAEGAGARRLERLGDKASDEVWFDIAEEHGRDRVHRLLGRRRRRRQVLALVKDGAQVESACSRRNGH